MNKYFKYVGFSMFEITLTIIITSIIFVVVGLFMAKPIVLFTKMSQEAKALSQLNVALRRIANDFSQYAGGISITSGSLNTLSLKFNMPSGVIVTYLCDFNNGLVYRQSSNQGTQLLLNNLTGCIFKNNISTDNKTIFLSIRLVIAKNNMPVTLTEILNVPNV